MNIDEILKKSQYYPSQAEFARHSFEKGNYPIDPRNFQLCSESCYIIYPAKDALEHVKVMTDIREREYGIVFYGIRKGKIITIADYKYNEGKRFGIIFNSEQKEFVKYGLSIKNGEIIYGHTHVASGNNYNFFSLNDLYYIVKNAVQFNRNVYGILITKDVTYLIKYDIKEYEFYRVDLNV